jgi:hypothetical protein
LLFLAHITGCWAFLTQIELKLVVREKMGKKTSKREREKMGKKTSERGREIERKMGAVLFWGRRRAREREREREKENNKIFLTGATVTFKYESLL